MVPMAESAASVVKADRASAMSRTSGAGGSSGPAIVRAKTMLAMIRTGTIDHSSTELCEGLRHYCEQHGLRVQVHQTEQGHDTVLQMLNEAENFADGVYVYPFETPEYVAALNRLVRMDFPVVAMRPVMGVNMSVVQADNCAGAMQATNYLLMKYRRPVYLFWTAGVSSNIERAEGFSRAMHDAGWGELVESHIFATGLDDSDPRIFGLAASPKVGVEGARRMLDAISVPASVYCTNDYHAASVYQAAMERGWVVGRDIAIVGFDDLPVASLLTPGLTTVHSFHGDIGYEVGSLLHKMVLRQVTSPMKILLPGKLVVRESA